MCQELVHKERWRCTIVVSGKIIILLFALLYPKSPYTLDSNLRKGDEKCAVITNGYACRIAESPDTKLTTKTLFYDRSTT
jgi:hypothetical protein